MGQRGFLMRQPAYVNFTKVCLKVVITRKSKTSPSSHPTASKQTMQNIVIATVEY